MKKIGLVLGLLLFGLFLLLPTPEGLSPEGMRAGAVAVLMAVWWMTEAIPLYATSLLPLVLYPLLGIMNAKEAAAPYAEPTIFLFMGGFFLAMAMQRWGLHRRVALCVIQILGTQPRRLLLGFMIATALISMWVSNTATTMMIYPIGLALITQFPIKDRSRFASALMLGIAYSASIGGVGTLIGTPPNAIFAGQAKLLFPDLEEVSFLKWMLVGVPYILLFLPMAWLYLSFIHIKTIVLEGDPRVLKEEMERLGPVSRGEIWVSLVFLLTVLGWIFREEMHFGSFVIPGWTNLLGVEKWVHDATVVIAASLILFIIPVNLKKGEFLLNWEWAAKIPWGVLVLFGGGFSLAVSFQETDLADWMGGRLTGLMKIPLPLFITALCYGVIFLGELTSNTAQTAMLMPILGSTAKSMGIHPYLLMIPATMSASSGFMLPVATPPNAIVFGSGILTIRQMVKAGFVLDLLGGLLVILVLYLIAIPVFGLG